jgi:hypothetical protein
MGDIRNSYRILVTKPEKRLLGRPRHRQVYVFGIYIYQQALRVFVN